MLVGAGQAAVAGKKLSLLNSVGRFISGILILSKMDSASSPVPVSIHDMALGFALQKSIMSFRSLNSGTVTGGTTTCGLVPVCSFGLATGAVSVLIRSGRGLDVTGVGLSKPLWPRVELYSQESFVAELTPMPELEPPMMTWS